MLKPLTRANEAQGGLGDISYTQTRVFKPDLAFLAEHRVIAGMESGPVIDAYKIMCVQVLQRLRERQGNSLAVVSPGESEGKTLTAINLALSLAQEVDQTVLLVDANLRDPGVHKYFGFTPEVGLSDHLIDGVPLGDVLINPGIERFVILPGGRPLVNSTEMLGSMKMERLVTELKMRYPSRIVLFDLPPVLSIADAMAFAPYVDSALMVVQENKTRRAELLRAAEMLKSVDVLGTVLNMAAEAALEEKDERSAMQSLPSWPELRAWWQRTVRRGR
ncbi:MAG: AAA family ATPase [Rhodocyclales bacterium]|nr:AAA family ATPase [Rhodocyclales bacterium]